MRFIHTSDWHLGRAFHGVGLLDAQAAYVDHLVELVRHERVDAVLVSGDIYDRALPAPDTVALLDETVVRLLDTGTQVVLSSGNHDSAVRLGFGSRVLARSGLHIRTSVADLTSPVTVGDTHIYPIPYLEPALAADLLDADGRTHASVLREAMTRIRAAHAGRARRSVVMAHAFVTGATTSDSERDISVGGMGAVPVEVFEGVDYAALGHLHGPQEIRPHVRYSGSPVAMSFSESEQVKGSWLVDLSDAGMDHQFIPAPVLRPLARLRGELEDLLEGAAYAEAGTSWCQITLTDETRPLGAMERLRARFPHTLQLLFDGPTDLRAPRSYGARVQGRSDLDLCCDFLEHVREGAGASAAERTMVRTALSESAAARRAHDGEGGLSSDAPVSEPGRAGAA